MEGESEKEGVVYPFLVTGQPVKRIYRSLLIADIFALNVALLILFLIDLDATIELILMILFFIATIMAIRASMYTPEPSKIYDRELGLKYWTEAPEYERKIVEDEIRRQFPMQIAIHSSIMQRAGVILGFGFVIMTTFLSTAMRSTTFTSYYLVTIFMLAVLYGISCWIGLMLFVSPLSRATTGSSIRHIMKYDWGEERLRIENINSDAESYFSMIEQNSNANQTLSLMCTLEFVGLIPILMSIILGVLT